MSENTIIPVKIEEQESADILKLRKIDQSGFEAQEHRHESWLTNYQLMRDTIPYNRLTHRQNVTLPLMRISIDSIMKDIDDPPLLYFNSKDNDDQKELFYNEYWKHVSQESKLVIQDIIDKNNVILYGRSFKFLNIMDGMATFEIVPPKNVKLGRYMNPAILETSPFLVRDGMYKDLDRVLHNEDFDKSELDKLKALYNSAEGQLLADKNSKEFQQQQEELDAMGDQHTTNPALPTTVVQLSESYVFEYEETEKQYLIVYYVRAENKYLLLKKKLHEVIGKTKDDFWKTHYPITTWGSKVEGTDVWCDAVADTLRGVCTVLNTYWSGKVENRILKNFHMSYYDATKGDGLWQPETWSPEPFGFYGVPGNPNDLLKEMSVGDQNDSMDDINFLLDMAGRASAAQSTNQGSVEQKKVTLGEIQLALTNAKERVKSMAVFYNDSWLEFGLKYTKMLEAAGDKLIPVEITRKGKTGKKWWTRIISPSDWESVNGYLTDVKLVSAKDQEDADTLNRLSGVKQFFNPGNTPLNNIVQKKAADFAGMSLDEKKEVLDFERNLITQAATAAAGMTPGMGGTMISGAPTPSPIPSSPVPAAA